MEIRVEIEAKHFLQLKPCKKFYIKVQVVVKLADFIDILFHLAVCFTVL